MQPPIETRFGPGPLNGLRVMIAEDNAFTAHELELMLMEEGARVLGPFDSVEKACTCLDQHPVDFIIIDLELVDDFADEVVRRSREAGIPYAIVTGYRAFPTNAGDGAVAYLLKPVDRDHLVRLLAQFAQ